MADSTPITGPEALKACIFPIGEVVQQMKDNPNSEIPRQQRRAMLRWLENKAKRQRRIQND
jgi:hypothetical protein